MGTVKYTGPVASFHCPTEATIRSLKVHFSPKQLGSGDPSPENIREIVGWDGVTVHNDDGIVIPEEYQKVEYLESDGNQYLITEYIPQIDDDFLIDIYLHSIPTSVNTAVRPFFSGNGTVRVGIVTNYYATYYTYFASGGAPDIGGKRISTSWSKIELGSDGKIYVNGNYCGQDTRQRFGFDGTDNRLYLLQNALNIGATTVPVSIRSMLVTNNSAIKLNLIPCLRKSDNKPGMYDTVSGEFFTNQGTGEFICGPDMGETTDYEFGVLGKNKFNVNAEYQAPDNTEMLPANNRIFTLNTYCTGMSWSNYYNPSQTTSYSINNGTITITNVNVYGLGFPIQAIAGQTYYLSATTTNGRAHIAYFASDGTYLSGVSTNILNSSFTVPNNVDIMIIVLFSNSGEATFSNIQLELGSTATAYEPYNPNHTVYGGWVDLVSGEVCEEWTKEFFNGTEPWAANSDTYRFALQPSNNFPYKEYGQINIYGDKLYLTGRNSNRYVYLVTAFAARFETVDDLKNYLIEQDSLNTPVQCVYELAIPNTYYIAPTQLQTFLGQNNVWSNADYVEVEYDLHETQTILERKAFILANQPHLEEVSGSVASFSTDMKAPLKSCKINFLPVQAGSGDPSLENVREIKGWNGIIASANRAPLSEEYQEVEYIQSNSEYSYFITDYYPNDKTDYYVKTLVQSNGSSTVGAYVFSSSGLFDLYKPNHYYVFSYVKGTGNFRTGGLGVNRGLGEHLVIGKTIKYTASSGVTYNYTMSDYESFQCTSPLIIYGINIDGVITNYYSGANSNRLYRLTLYENSITVRDYVPCYRKSDNEVGLYDLVNKTFLTHSGEGTFSAGPDITTGSLYFTNFPSVINVLSTTTITTNKTLSAAGEEISENGMSLTNYIKVSEGDTYKLIFTSKEGPRTRRIYGYDVNKEPIESLAAASWVTVDTTYSLQATIPTGIEYIKVCYKTADENIFLEGPESSVIYGGYVDLANGVLVGTWVLRDMSTFGTITPPTGSSAYWSHAFSLCNWVNTSWDKAYGVRNVYCDCLQYASVSDSPVQYSFTGISNAADIYVYDDTISTKEEFKAKYAGHYFAYELKPTLYTTYQLTPTTLKSLIGTNNLFSNTNSTIETTYWTH